MSDNTTYERIESYLLGKMNEAEKTAFEAEAEANEALARRLAQQEMEHKMMEALVEDDLLADLKKWKAEDDAQSKTNASAPLYRRPFPWIILLGLLGLVTFLIWPERQETPQTEPDESPVTTAEDPGTTPPPDTALAKPEEAGKSQTKQEKPVASQPPNTGQTTSQDDKQEELLATVNNTFIKPAGLNEFRTVVRGKESLLSQAIDDLMTKNQPEAGIRKLYRILESDAANPNAHLFLGLALYNEKRYAEAIPHLEALIENGHLYEEQARWFLSLCYIQDKKYKKAEQLIRLIAEDEEHAYHQEAFSLLPILEGQK
ncbi:MAG: CDC27 family protein [Phaeodactylibacter sp.]|nr:CDC27 family protein [Phaeodactylibacter sp.]